MKKVLTFLVSAMCALLMFTGCPTPNSESGENSTDSTSMKAQLAKLENPSSLSTGKATGEIKKEEGTEDVSDDSADKKKNSEGLPITTVTKTKKVKLSGSYDESYLLNPSTDIIYPGSVIQGDSIDKGTYIPVSKGEKNEVTVSFQNLTGVKDKDGNNGKVTGKIIPTLSNYQTLHTEIMNQTIGGASGTVTFSSEKVTTKEELSFAVSANAAYNSASFKVSAGVGTKTDTGEETYTYLVKFAQTFYTVNLDLGDIGFLYKNIDMNDIGSKKPVYVSSIAYGRLGYLTVTTSKKWDTIDADLNTCISSVKADASVSASTMISNSTSNANIQITTVGFTGSNVTVDDFFRAISNDGFSSTNAGQIVAYKLRFVDTNEVANTVFNGEYTIVKTEFVTGKINFNFNKIECDHQESDAGSSSELFGSILLDNKVMWERPNSNCEIIDNNSREKLSNVTNVTITKTSSTESITPKITFREDDNTGCDDYAINYTPTECPSVSNLVSNGSPFSVKLQNKNITFYFYYTYTYSYQKYVNGKWSY